MNIAYYVSGHGFGHISRSYEVIKFLLERKEVERIFLNTKRAAFIKQNHDNLFFRDVGTDVGIIQLNSLSMDLSKTLESIYAFEKVKPVLLEEEISFLQNEKIDCIISDCSSFPFLMADKLKLPSYCISNFTWDFIYENYEKENPYFKTYAKSLHEEYSLCKLGLVLPFHCPIESIKRKIKIGIIGRNSLFDKFTIRKKLGFQDENRYFLFSFGAYGISEKFDFSKLRSGDWIVTSGYEDLKGEKVMDMKDISYPDLVKACDYVLTKPGYGILSEAHLADTPVIYTDRGDFAEYEYLANALQIYHRSAYISQKELLSFDLERAIDKIQFKQKARTRKILPDGREDILRQIF